ncbi:MAG: hypothetical protein COA42_05165 [Alteromonadaceae bacterium]|nr:MAG: hypothetical protein COA42_05165 [Alteromonadaceae bacterium]
MKAKAAIVFKCQYNDSGDIRVMSYVISLSASLYNKEQAMSVTSTFLLLVFPQLHRFHQQPDSFIA